MLYLFVKLLLNPYYYFLNLYELGSLNSQQFFILSSHITNHPKLLAKWIIEI